MNKRKSKSIFGDWDKHKPTGKCMDTAFDIPCFFRDNRGYAHCRHFCDARKKIAVIPQEKEAHDEGQDKNKQRA